MTSYPDAHAAVVDLTIGSNSGLTASRHEPQGHPEAIDLAPRSWGGSRSHSKLTPVVHRRSLAILAADITGYTRLIEFDDLGTALQVQRLRHRLMEPTACAHDGWIIDRAGDSTMMAFARPSDAVACAIAIQRWLDAAERDLAECRRIRLRIGISAGEVLVIDGAFYGHAVNLAARLQALAVPGGICLAANVRDQLRDDLTVRCEMLGRRRLRNIARPVRVYRIARNEVSG
jgi:adenylate cyclase